MDGYEHGAPGHIHYNTQQESGTLTMYGLLNKAIEDLVVTNFGESQWKEICKEAGLPDEPFISMQVYPDQVTFDLVGAASKVLKLSPEDVMRTFGEFWTLYTAKEGYGDLMQQCGKTLPEFLQNLDTLHTRVGMMMPDLKPPSFACENIESNSLDLHYKSTREGLDPVVEGLIIGLGKMLGQEASIKRIVSREDGASHSVFRVEWK